ncbi:dipeptidase PepV [Paenibacillus sp. GYB004]|uniref:dipeptidase PepV n=1 Tax=Paenibacillus sp. GYB004 TaxID=2994393 RepID=UPI002F9697A3
MDWYGEVLKRKEALLADLRSLLRIPSVKDPATQRPGQPMGAAIAQALDWMLEQAESSGFRTRNLDGYAGYAEYGESRGEDYIGVLCHLDVVPATGEWTHPPFEPAIVDGKLYARGAIDDKGPTIAAYYALKIVQESGLPLKHNVRLIFGTDEESGMACVRKYVEEEQMPVAAFSPDAGFPIIHAEKGQLNPVFTLDLTAANKAKSAPTCILASFEAGERTNMVPDKAVVRMKAPRPLLERLAAEFQRYGVSLGLPCEWRLEESSGSAELMLYGKSAHGAYPMKGLNAALFMAQFLRGYELDAAGAAYIAFLDGKLAGDCYGEKLGIAYMDDISGPLTVNAGVLRYEHGKGGFVSLNIRCPVTTDFPAAIAGLEAAAAVSGMSITSIGSKKPHYIEASHPLIRTLQRVYEGETGQEPTLLSIGGATYAGLMGNCVAFGAMFPGKEGTAHQKDEYIELDDLFKATAIYARAIYELANADYGDGLVERQ